MATAGCDLRGHAGGSVQAATLRGAGGTMHQSTVGAGRPQGGVEEPVRKHIIMRSLYCCPRDQQLPARILDSCRCLAQEIAARCWEPLAHVQHRRLRGQLDRLVADCLGSAIVAHGFATTGPANAKQGERNLGPAGRRDVRRAKRRHHVGTRWGPPQDRQKGCFQACVQPWFGHCFCDGCGVPVVDK